MKDDTAVNQTTTTLVDNWHVFRRLPQVCLLCGAPGNHSLSLCNGCIADLPHTSFSCPVCALPMSDNILCAHCLNNKRHLVDCTTALFNYRYPVNLLVHNIKYHADLVAAGILGQLLANHLKTEGVELPECILPVPLHPLRLAMRGYNQALEIARPLSTSLGLPIETTLCKRARYTGPQARLSPIERKRNVHNAFALNRNNKYRHIAIIDDVMTTGSTMRELAKLFRGTGTVYIQAWVCARAVTR